MDGWNNNMSVTRGTVFMYLKISNIKGRGHRDDDRRSRSIENFNVDDAPVYGYIIYEFLFIILFKLFFCRLLVHYTG